MAWLYLDGGVRACGGNAGAVGVKGDARDHARGLVEGVSVGLAGQIPQFDLADGREAGWVGRRERKTDGEGDGRERRDSAVCA